MEFIQIWLATLITFLIAFILGYIVAKPERVDTIVQKVKTIKKKIPKKNPQVGPIEKLPAEELAKEGTPLAKTEEGMNIDLDKIFKKK